MAVAYDKQHMFQDKQLLRVYIYIVFTSNWLAST